MNKNQFDRLAGDGFNRIPVYREILADLETPLSSYVKLASGPYSFLFESVEGGEKWGRYSIIGLPCRRRICIVGDRVEHWLDDTCLSSEQSASPLDTLAAYQAEFKVPEVDDLPRFSGGFVGYFGYDTVRYIEPKLAGGAPSDELNTPDVLLMLAEDIVVFDNLSGTLKLITHVDPSQAGAYENALAQLDKLESKLPAAIENIGSVALSHSGEIEGEVKAHFSKDDFFSAVANIKEYVLSGDTMQVVISQRMSMPFDAPPINLYRALRALNPSPYMYYLNLGDHHVVGSSPEILARLENNEVTVRPIAGTRRRGHNAAEDALLEADLLADPKEIAEHLMLIDLGRNDVGRVAQVGSVKLTEKMVVERYSHVMHITSNVTGQLKPELGYLDVLRAAMPAGTLSGAPKVRAMQIIDELEPVKRGIYGGAVGYIGWNGNMDTAIAIRTAVVKDNKMYVQAGAGVVADSQPELEWKETMNKARAVLRAASMVKGGAK